MLLIGEGLVNYNKYGQGVSTKSANSQWSYWRFNQSSRQVLGRVAMMNRLFLRVGESDIDQIWAADRLIIFTHNKPFRFHTR